MSEIGLFPLGLVLLPTEQVPLHIFEPRYRELIEESLEEDVPFGVVYADEDGLRQIGTLATVTEVTERFEDGRLNILVEGGDRFRLLELTEGRTFVTGRWSPSTISMILPRRRTSRRALVPLCPARRADLVRRRGTGRRHARALVCDRRLLRLLAGSASRSCSR